MNKFGLSLIVSLAFVTNLLGQQIKPVGRFFQDSIAIGEPVKYSLSVRYPAEFQILMPDSLYSFAPFEYSKKQYFSTKSDSIQSYDSVIYTLLSFEIDKIQRLKLPIYLIQGEDSTAIFSETDSIILEEQIEIVSDTLKIKTDAVITKLDKEFNYPYFLAFLGLLALFALLVLLVFGKGLRKKWKIWRLTRRHEKFKSSFEEKLSFVANISAESIEELLYMWKKHAEFISRTPYAKLTSKEINQLQQNEELYENLQLIDKMIYSSKGKNNASESFHFLLKYAAIILEERIKAIEDGK